MYRLGLYPVLMQSILQTISERWNSNLSEKVMTKVLTRKTSSTVPLYFCLLIIYGTMGAVDLDTREMASGSL